MYNVFKAGKTVSCSTNSPLLFHSSHIKMILVLQLNALSVFGIFLLIEVVSGYYGYNGTNICCDGKFGDLTMFCCGKGQLYKTNEALCCNKTIVPLPSKDTSVNNQYSCCFDSWNKQPPKLYNYKTSVCCNGAILKKEDPNIYYDCCNASKLYDPKKFICCNNEVLKRENKACCGEALAYEPATQICAKYFDHDKQKTTYQVKDIQNNHTKSCDLELYDTLNETCCGFGNFRNKVVPSEKGIKYPGCCSGKTRASNGTVIQQTDPTVFDLRSQICCETGQVLDLPTSAWGKYALCCGGKISYINQTCCGGKIFEGKGSCCGDQLLQDNNLFCCNGVGVKQSKNRELACCEYQTGSQLYNVTTKLCCGSQLYDRTSLYQVCCSSVNKPYDALSQACTELGVIDLDLKEKETVKKLCGPTFTIY